MPVRDGTDDLIAFLNSLVEIDRYAMAELLCIMVPCNQVLADHPSVQVAAGGERSGRTFIAPNTFRVGMLGVLNGFCGTLDDGPQKGWPPIVPIYADGKLLRFERRSGIVAVKQIGEIDAWIEREFSGYGVAIRLRDDPPIPGEPFMSMKEAKNLTRRAVAEFAPEASFPSSSAAAISVS